MRPLVFRAADPAPFRQPVLVSRSGFPVALHAVDRRAVDVVDALVGAVLVAVAGGVADVALSGFAQALQDAVHRVDAQEQTATDRMAQVESGRSDDLVGAMIASQQANLSFSMLTQVRNKLAGALDELIKLQL